jgi:hypothetical protein
MEAQVRNAAQQFHSVNSDVYTPILLRLQELSGLQQYSH